MNYLDANFATALHFNIRGQTELAEKFVRKNSSPFVFSELAELECRRAFILRTGKRGMGEVYRARATKLPASQTENNLRSTPQINIVLNWFEELKQRVPNKP